MSQSPAKPLEPGRGPVAHGMRVLVMVDSKALLARIRDGLVAAGMEVTTAATGPEVFALTRDASEAAEPFEAVVVDAATPELNGLRVIGRFKAQGLVARTVALVSQCPEQADRARSCGADTVLAKPFDVAALCSAIASANPPRRLAG